MAAPAIADAFRLLQAGHAAAALESACRVLALQPANARAHLASGLALRALGRIQESVAAIGEAARLDPRDYAAAYENGMALKALGSEDARRCFENAVRLRPAFAPAHYALGMLAFERGDWARAVAGLRAAADLDPGNSAAAVNLGLALAEAGELQEAEERLQRAATKFDGLPAARHALGWTLLKRGRPGEAIGHLQAAVAAQSDARWRVDLAKALADAAQENEAREEFEAAVASAPQDPFPRVAFGRYLVRLADYARAAQLFRSAWELAPADVELPMYVAQVELLRGRRRDAWHAYARRDPRIRFEAERAKAGFRYAPPPAQAVQGRHLLVHAEQGLGDELFFLRFAALLREHGARLSYIGDARLGPLLRRAGLFESVLAFGEAWPPGIAPVLCADLPSMLPEDPTPPSLAIAPEAARVEVMRARLQRAGPRPWIGVTWRAGTPKEQLSHALHKEAPIRHLFAALPRAGTVVSLQRDGHFEELETASGALGAPIHDFSNVNLDLDDALALLSLLDRHVGVSNTNMHLAAAAGATADVLVPFPPEWRWGLEGDSPWFPGFRVYRQSPSGDWSRAFAELANASAGSMSRG
ncbi:MAG TPA: tetratricopeptide repeat protein [Usitatibacter sp.]|nr:tetratricopeptide repeat protein [Usitatibacter sp.]